MLSANLRYPNEFESSMRKHLPSFLILFLFFSTTAISAQDLASFEKRITVHKLANGLTVVIMERPEAPVFSFYTHVDAGAAQEVEGITGLAHMFEHMAFKGTHEIGRASCRERV